MPNFEKRPSSNRGHYKTLHKKSNRVTPSDQSFIGFQNLNDAGGIYESLLWHVLPRAKHQGQESVVCNPQHIGSLVQRIILNVFIQKLIDRNITNLEIIALYAYLCGFSHKDAAIKLKEPHNV